MANPNLLDPQVRKQIINDIRSQENVNRKAKSLKDYEIYNDNAYQYVYEKIKSQLSESTADQMPIVSTLNIAKAVVKKEAEIYTDDPERTYENCTEADKEVLEHIYEDSQFNSKLGKSNKYYKLRNQSFVQVVPKQGTLKLRVLHGHNIDVIPDSDDPEQAYAYIISSFDKAIYLKAGQDHTNQVIADADDYQSTKERFQVWTKELTFVMNGKGDVVTEIIDNPIQMLPFVDIAKDKDFEFFVRIGQALTDFTVDFNVAWSDLMYTMRMQGFSVGVLSGDANLKPQSMTVGPGKFLFLPNNPSNPDSKLELDFKSPNPNLDANQKSIDALIATFLTTRGIDSKSVGTTGAKSYSSALERLLAMIDQFRASKEDFDLYRMVEKQVHQIVVKYLALLSGTQFLNPEYSVSQGIVNSELSVKFHRPEMIETESEKLDNAKKEIDLGIADRVTILSDIECISIEEAQKQIDEIDQRKLDRIANISIAANQTPAP